MIRTRRSAPASMSGADDGILPMVNVVFLLLMFFMVAGEITSRGEPLPLPESSSDQRADRQVVRVDIPSAGVLLIDGKPLSGSLEEALRAIEISAADRTSEPGDSISGERPRGVRDVRRDRVLAVHVARGLDVAELDQVLVQMRGSPSSKLRIITRARP